MLGEQVDRVGICLLILGLLIGRLTDLGTLTGIVWRLVAQLCEVGVIRVWWPLCA
ncbi:MAG: hypothetical protein ACE5JD_07350 [Candidatus Methylomirabilia bacterium]